MSERAKRILFHTVGAAVFFFVLQRFALQQSLEVSVLWAVALGAAAGLLARSQER